MSHEKFDWPTLKLKLETGDGDKRIEIVYYLSISYGGMLAEI